MSSLTHHSSKQSLFNANTNAEAVVKKLLHSSTSRRTHTQNRGAGSIEANPTTLHRVTSKTTQSINDVENIFEIMPETELAMQILVSSIMSPNDMRTPELTWTSTGTVVPTEAAAEMTEIIKKHFEDELNIKGTLQSMLEDALFYTGSYPIMIIPENSLDDIINDRSNVSMESIKPFLDTNNVCKSMGILGPGLPKNVKNKKSNHAVQSTASLEDFFKISSVVNVDSKSSIDPLVTITDNYSAARMPHVVDRFRASNVAKAISRRGSIGTEARDDEVRNLTLSDVATTFYERKSNTVKNTVEVKSTDQSSRVAVGHPMTLKLPSDSIIPVHVPSDPKDHLGYYVLLDMYGNPVSNARDSSYYKELSNITEARKREVSSNLLEHVGSSLSGSGSEATADDIAELEDIYSRAMEHDLLHRLRSGLYGQNVEISNANEIYRIMFARKCADMQTQVLFVPAELMTYVAFDYNRSGVGRSLLEKSKMLASIRAILLFSNTMASINNSINSKQVNIELSPEDMEPEATVDMILTELARKESGGLPLASTNPMDIVDGIKRSVTQTVVTGNSNWADTKVTVDNQPQNNVVVDNQLEERLRDRHLMSMSVNPELVDSSTTIDFAIEAINRNLLFNKRLSNYQNLTERFLSSHISKYSINSGKLMKELILVLQKTLAKLSKGSDAVKDAVEEELIDADKIEAYKDLTYSEMISDFLNCLEVGLPNPDNTKLANQLEQVETYSRALDSVLIAYFGEESLNEDGENARVKLEIVKGFFLRQYVIENNILPEVHNLFKAEGDPQLIALLEQHDTTSSAISRLVDNIVKRNSNKTDDGDNQEY